MLFRSDRKSTRLNSSHTIISYAVFCLKKKKPTHTRPGGWRDDAPAPAVTPRVRGAVVRRWVGQERWDRTARGCPSFGLVFFLNDPAPPGISPFPPRAAFRS